MSDNTDNNVVPFNVHCLEAIEPLLELVEEIKEGKQIAYFLLRSDGMGISAQSTSHDVSQAEMGMLSMNLQLANAWLIEIAESMEKAAGGMGEN